MQDFRPILTAAVMAIMAASAASGQSLGDLARKEEARRKTVKDAGKVYTNDNLGGGGNVVPTPVPAPAPAAPAAPGTGPGQDKDAKEDPKKGEAYWRDRVAQARQGLERAKMFQEALQTRINSLGNDFAARDDPSQRQALSADRQKALAELERVKKEIADYQKQLSDIEDEARRAGVPPGWVR